MTSLQRSATAVSRAAASQTTSKQADDPIFLDPSDDPTFQSLKKLLSAPSSSTQHLSLLSESTLYGSITFYLSKLELEHVAEFAGVISSSGCLWTPPPPANRPPSASKSGTAPDKVTWTSEPGSSTSSSDKSVEAKSSPNSTSSSLSSFLISRSTSVSQAVAAALTKRVDLIVRSKKNSTGWATRSALSHYLSAIIQGIDDTERDATPESYRAARGLPIPRFAIIGGLLNALYILKDQRKRTRDMSILEEMAALRANPSLGLSVRRPLSTIQDEWIVTLAEILDHLYARTTPSPDPDLAESGSQGNGDVDEWEVEFRKRTASVAGPASITSLASKRTLRAALSDVRDVPLYMAAQLAPLVPDRKIHALDPVQLTSATSDAILSLFEGPDRSSFLSSLAQDVHTQQCSGQQTKILVNPSGSTATILQSVLDSTLFPFLGPLSKLMSRALAKAVTSLTPEEISSLLLGTADAALETQIGDIEFFPLLIRMSRLSSRLEAAWLDSPLAGAKEEEIVESSRQLTKQLWTTFKTLLFSYTMVFDSMMDALVDMCPSPTLTIPPAVGAETQAPEAQSRRWPSASTSNLPQPYLLVVQHVLATYSHLYWITSTFGSDGFDVYRKVFYSALDVIGRDGEACIQLLELIAPVRVDPTDPSTIPADALESNAAKRSSTTYFLNVAEQLVAVLPDQVVEQLVLPICQPYLENTRFSDTFESAHSVVLALYSNHKRCILNLAPFYVGLLISSYPRRLTAMQFEYAMSTVVGAVSDRSDSVAWWVITRLAEEVDRERLGEGGAGEGGKGKSVQAGGFVESSGVTRGELEDASINSDSTHPSERAIVDSSQNDDNVRPETGSDMDTYDRLTHLQMCLIGCIPSVNLVLLRSALAKVEAYIMQHKQREASGLGSNAAAEVDDADHTGSSRVALCQKTFDAIQALNAATREEGLRWWLDHRVQFGV
ncbi:putative peroxisomal matrix Pex8 protein [Pseudozyma hubeiensis]|nr:putative peroxisomal matrix Pex8 protein [Pseudozyma hubeiensis]